MTIRETFVSLGVLAMLGTVEAAAAAGPPGGVQVDVVNTPLPVTGSVSGTIGLAPGTAVGLAPGTSVQIDNTVGNPVRVRNVNDAIQPVQVTQTCTTTAIGCGGTIYTVPAGKRLVVEYASMSVCSLPGQSAQLSISTTIGGAAVEHFVSIAPPAAGPGSNSIGCNPLVSTGSSLTAVGQPVRLYADAGTLVGANADRTSNTGNATFTFSISGYLVDVPLTP